MLEIPKILDYSGYDNYPSESNPTTNADIMNYFRNQNKLLQAMAAFVWQPLTNYTGGQAVFSPNMPAGYYAVVTKAGQTGRDEPKWSSADQPNYSDGSVNWRLSHISSVYSVDGVQADANGAIVTPIMQGATSSRAGKAGRVPAPGVGEEDKYLGGDGKYHGIFSNSKEGLIPAGGNNPRAVLRADGAWSDDANLKTYIGLEQLGLDGSTLSWQLLYNALPINSTLIFYGSLPKNFPRLEFPNNISQGHGFSYKIVKDSYSMLIELRTIIFSYIGFYTPNTIYWQELADKNKLSMPSDKGISISNLTTPFVAPCDGYLYLNLQCSKYTKETLYYYLRVNNREDIHHCGTMDNMYQSSMFIPLAKGDKIIQTDKSFEIDRIKNITFYFAESGV